ncbi:uncharacterized protein HaLaN_23134 [Haematococcus lacustris]|uniref:Uncharacterized protein n=1 Tax=Haematococcus lacustris TaxID=44745 RepID=A0A6A0A0Z6_HAELA|nr:uncharacterized protein HaLaN_23134 [Haematococcus lacustris]
MSDSYDTASRDSLLNVVLDKLQKSGKAKTSVIMSILRDMLAAGPQEHRLAEARVVASTEDIPMRCFGAWHAAFINTATNTDNIDAADSTTIVKSASELNASMRKLGGSLTDLTESELKRRLAAMDQYCEDLPAPELLMSLVPAEDAPTVEEFLDIFDAPVTVELDSEKVWPMPSMLKAWN